MRFIALDCSHRSQSLEHGSQKYKLQTNQVNMLVQMIISTSVISLFFSLSLADYNMVIHTSGMSSHSLCDSDRTGKQRTTRDELDADLGKDKSGTCSSEKASLPCERHWSFPTFSSWVLITDSVPVYRHIQFRANARSRKNRSSTPSLRSSLLHLVE